MCNGYISANLVMGNSFLKLFVHFLNPIWLPDAILDSSYYFLTFEPYNMDWCVGLIFMILRLKLISVAVFIFQSHFQTKFQIASNGHDEILIPDIYCIRSHKYVFACISK